jgi:hypothetical protein
VRSLILAGALSVALFGLAAAQTPPEQIGATLRFEPTRLVLDADRPSGTIHVTASEDITVDVDFLDRVMTEQGAILDLDAAREAPGAEGAIARLRSAAPLLAPVARRLHLRPGESVAIEVALARPRGRIQAGQGEHRTHLTISPVAPASPAPPSADGGAPATVNWRYALPMIVRGPDVPARAALAVSSQARAVPGLSSPSPDAVDIEIWRAGDRSLYGDLVVKDAAGKVLAALEGLAVYPEIDRRVVRLALPPRSAGPLEVQFVDRDARPGAVLARLALPQGRQLAAEAPPPSTGARPCVTCRPGRDTRLALAGPARQGAEAARLR